MHSSRLVAERTGSPGPALLVRGAAGLLSAVPLLVSLLWLGGMFRRTYGPTHYFLNYQHGFVKRGLLGELLAHVGFLSLHTIFAIEMAIFATVLVATYGAFRRFFFGTLEQRALAALLFSAPALLPHFAYLSGDLDSVLYVLMVLAVWSLVELPAVAGFVLSLVLSIAALLVHEANLLLFYPAIAVLLLDRVRSKRLALPLAVMHVVLVGLAFVAIVHFGKWTAPHPEYLAAAQQRTDMPLEGTVFLVLSSTLTQQLHFVRALYTTRLLSAIVLTCLLSLPYFAMLGWLLERSLRDRDYAPRLRWAVMALLCAPLLLLPLGHDAMRWIAGIAVNATLVVLALESTGAARQSRTYSDENVTRWSWTGSPLYPAMLGYVIALGAYGIASCRLATNLGNLLSGHP